MKKAHSLVLTVFVLQCIYPGLATAAPDNMDYAALSCNELYMLAANMEPRTQRFRSPLFNEKTNVIATAIGSVTTVGYYYFGFAVTRDYYEDYRSHQRLGELDRVRRQLAQNYCFQKF